MGMMYMRYGILLIFLSSLINACGNGQKTDMTIENSSALIVETNNHGSKKLQKQSLKRTAPISIKYSFVGTPVIGQALGVNLDIASTMKDKAITMRYRINVPDKIDFAVSQVSEVILTPLSDGRYPSQQVLVIPKQEGRHFLIASAGLTTERGVMVRSMSIPIQVGSVPLRVQTSNGKLVKGVSGELGISLPSN
tara:strand:+ start:5913 stop:6494 length:582 start_codon:yes stop_codon:yes gene_type:complete